MRAKPMTHLAYFLTVFIVLGAAQITVAQSAARRDTPIVRAVRNARPAVVNIHSEKTALYETATSLEPFENGKRINGMGTGVIVDERGYIITNYHVVEGVQTISVTLSNGERSEARLISHDPKHDLAMIKIEATHALPVMKMGHSSDLMLGETVIALGNAFGYENTVTTGIISALGRNVEVNETQSYVDLIQTDASINPGNSGGPLMNIDGDWVGVNVAIRAGAQGIGFAIPIDKVQEQIVALLNTKLISGTWHGMRCSLPQTKGMGENEPGAPVALITSLDTGSPALKAGLVLGDHLVEVEGRPVSSALDVERALLDKTAGDKVSIRIQRNGQERVLSLTLEPDQSNPYHLTWSQLGMRMEPVGATVVRRVAQRYNGGLRVVGIRAGSPAAQQGIQRGDIILGLDLYEVINLQNLIYVLKRAEQQHSARLRYRLLRGGEVHDGQLILISSSL